ncbi:hypothetical protein [Flavobacterium flavipallidum]|uniref:DUF4890 domain-containing protein n=1 Tax=Flavobacterium flavipallidum TaxID=3139140 RepID=A0ABU9HRH3_9FLAO
MKKIILLFRLMLISSLSFGQNKPKSMKILRDSIFTVMKLSNENRLKMHELIAENGKTQKAIKEDATLTEEQRKEKLQAWKKDITAEERKILTTEQFEIWRDFGKSSKQK